MESKVRKLADRYNNMSNFDFGGSEYLKERYLREADEFYLEFARRVDRQVGNSYWYDLLKEKTEELRIQLASVDSKNDNIPYYRRLSNLLISWFRRINQKP